MKTWSYASNTQALIVRSRQTVTTGRQMIKRWGNLPKLQLPVHRGSNDPWLVKDRGEAAQHQHPLADREAKGVGAQRESGQGLSKTMANTGGLRPRPKHHEKDGKRVNYLIDKPESEVLSP